MLKGQKRKGESVPSQGANLLGTSQLGSDQLKSRQTDMEEAKNHDEQYVDDINEPYVSTRLIGID